MIWWLIAAAIGVLGIANGILMRLRRTAGTERQRWHNEYAQLEREMDHYEQQIRERVAQAQWTVDFTLLTQLHHESMRAADHAHRLLSDARVALDAIGAAIHDAGTEKDRLIAEKRRTLNPFKSSQMEQEIAALIELRGQLFPDKDALKGQRDRFYEQVKRLNAQTHQLKTAICDRCGPQGRDWHARLEARSERRRLGLPPGTGEARVRGRVKWYNSAKGFGFITPDSGDQDVFVSRRSLNGVSSLCEGDAVEFSIRSGDKGPWAFGVVRAS